MQNQFIPQDLMTWIWLFILINDIGPHLQDYFPFGSLLQLVGNLPEHISRDDQVFELFVLREPGDFLAAGGMGGGLDCALDLVVRGLFDVSGLG